MLSECIYLHSEVCIRIVNVLWLLLYLLYFHFVIFIVASNFLICIHISVHFYDIHCISPNLYDLSYCYYIYCKLHWCRFFFQQGSVHYNCMNMCFDYCSISCIFSLWFFFVVNRGNILKCFSAFWTVYELIAFIHWLLYIAASTEN